MPSPSIRTFQERFDFALSALALVFTDLLIHTEQIDAELEKHQHRLEAHEDRITYLEAQIAALRRGDR